MEQKALKLIMAGLLILSMALTGREAAEYVGAMHAVNALRETGMGADDSGRLCVVVDAGHGGDDPGKIGINGAPEKDINLQIAQKLKKYLEAEDVEVVLTHQKGGEGAANARQDVFSKSITLTGPELTPEQHRKLIEIAAKCPVQRTLEGTPLIRTLENAGRLRQSDG